MPPLKREATLFGLLSLFPARSALRSYFSKMFWGSYWRSREQEEFARSQKTIVLSGSERAMLIEAICAEAPIDSILEVGCAYGQNFSAYAHLLPATRKIGVDIDFAALTEARVFHASVPNLEFVDASVTDLSKFPDRSIDIVYSCALMLYVGPEDAAVAAREMVRVAKRAVFLMEQHDESMAGNEAAAGRSVERPSNGTKYWIRNYKLLFEQAAPGRKIEVAKIANPNWSAERWKSLAHLITIDVS